MKKIRVYELDFISNLFTDKNISVTFKEVKGGFYVVSFVTDDVDDIAIDVLYTGDMWLFLAIISDVRIPDCSALCNISDVATSALKVLNSKGV